MTALAILGQAAGLVFVDKPPGLVSVAGRTPEQQERTVGRLLQETLQLPEAPLVCHRLDRDTSGVMLWALTPAAHRAANLAFESHQVRKTYVAWVDGLLTAPRLVDAPLGADPAAPRDARQKQHVDGQGKAARTRVVPLGQSVEANLTLVGARPSTGRTHQVRAHLAHLGHPLHGDAAYGGSVAPRVMLHAAGLSLFAMGTQHTAHAPLWEDMAALARLHLPHAPDAQEVDALLTRAARATG